MLVVYSLQAVIKAISFKLSTLKTTTAFCPFIPVSLTWTLFQGHSDAGRVTLKLNVFSVSSKPIKLKLCVVVTELAEIMTKGFSSYLLAFIGNDEQFQCAACPD